jgi:hypothetical protein
VDTRSNIHPTLFQYPLFQYPLDHHTGCYSEQEDVERDTPISLKKNLKRGFQHQVDHDKIINKWIICERAF